MLKAGPRILRDIWFFPTGYSPLFFWCSALLCIAISIYAIRRMKRSTALDTLIMISICALLTALLYEAHPQISFFAWTYNVFIIGMLYIRTKYRDH